MLDDAMGFAVGDERGVHAQRITDPRRQSVKFGD
jgi:hypothetical protein